MTPQIQPLPFAGLELHRSPFIYESRGHWGWDSVRRDHYNLWICTEGTAEVSCDGRVYPVQPWTAFVFPPDIHLKGRITRVGKGNCVLANFSAHWSPKTQKGQFGFPLCGFTVREVDTAQALIQALMRLSVFQDPLSRQQEEWVLLEMLALLWREWQTPHASDVEATIYRQIESMHSGRQLFSGVEALAAEANLSRIHYTRCFRRITGEAPNRFLIQQRIERACVLLRETDWTIATIAEAVGYTDVYFFSRQFRRTLNQTPSHYRQQERRALEDRQARGAEDARQQAQQPILPQKSRALLPGLKSGGRRGT